MRAAFPGDLQELRESLPAVLAVLDACDGGYASVYFERKSAKTFSVNLKQSNVAESSSIGTVLRVYDGHTLFEQATDAIDTESLLREARELVARVGRARRAPEAKARPYRPPTWKERLAADLDPEIRSQVPADVKAGDPVHFGIRYQIDPTVPGPEEHFARLKRIVSRLVEQGPSHGLSKEELSYVVARQGLAIEDSIFLDRETNLSQRLFRMSLTVIAMSGAERTYARVGGLGGLEAIEFSDREMSELLSDLACLKKAERLQPGKYRVLFGPVLSGVIAHEAFGHSQEADTWARGRSKAQELQRDGVRVGNSHATILNNPAVYQNGESEFAAWGSYFFDEEGWLAHSHTILDQGKLSPPMTNLTSSIRLGVPRTANGKRESWANGVYSRQTNTYFSPGEFTLDQLMSQVDDGFLATHAAGGMEDPKGMGIQVGISYLKEVKYGKLTGRVFRGSAGGDIQLTGTVPEVLDSILGKSKIEAERAGPDRAKHPFNDVGGCGKYHKEFVYAGCGGPYMLLDQVTLG